MGVAEILGLRLISFSIQIFYKFLQKIKVTVVATKQEIKIEATAPLIPQKGMKTRKQTIFVSSGKVEMK